MEQLACHFGWSFPPVFPQQTSLNNTTHRWRFWRQQGTMPKRGLHGLFACLEFRIFPQFLISMLIRLRLHVRAWVETHGKSSVNSALLSGTELKTMLRQNSVNRRRFETSS